MAETDNIQDIVKARFAELPQVVQKAITSADIQKRLRELADSHKLHLDQWEALENEVLMALLGATKPSELQQNIKKELDIPDDVAAALTVNISKLVFEPIRQELERSLDNPDAQKAVLTGVEQVGAAAIAQEKVSAAIPVAPATPPGAANTDKVVRAPISESYKAGEPSTARKSVHDDPYREPPA